MPGIDVLTLGVFVFAAALVLSFGITPVVKLFAHRIGAIDVPKDARRMHTQPTPRLGGLGIFFAFLIAVLVFVPIDSEIRAILLGTVILVVLGTVDDVVSLNPWIKLLFQIAAAVVAVANGVVVERITNFTFIGGTYIDLNGFGPVITILWIVGMTNAVNWIDGLDGLAVGVSTIASLSLLVIAAQIGDVTVALVLSALCGACIGFMPYNLNPAKIFMGDTGAMFLGYMLATLSVQGTFKFYAIVSFAAPFLILGLPLFDSVITIIRRLKNGKSPFYADRGHIHHRLIDMGLNQKQAVAILYAVSGILGLSAVVLTTSGPIRALFLIFALVASAALAIRLGTGKRSGNGGEEQTKQNDNTVKEEHKDEEN